MSTKAAPIVEWIKSNVPPLTWTTIKLKYMDVFLRYKVSPSKIDESTVFNQVIVGCINEFLRDKFNLQLPTNLAS